MYHKRGLWAIKAKNGGVFPKHAPKVKAPASAEKPPKFYPADDVKKPLPNKRKPKPTKLRYPLLSMSLSLWIHSFEFLNLLIDFVIFLFEYASVLEWGFGCVFYWIFHFELQEIYRVRKAVDLQIVLAAKFLAMWFK